MKGGTFMAFVCCVFPCLVESFTLWYEEVHEYPAFYAQCNAATKCSCFGWGRGCNGVPKCLAMASAC